MDTPITKDLNDRIEKHKERQFKEAMSQADKIRHKAISTYKGLRNE